MSIFSFLSSYNIVLTLILFRKSIFFRGPVATKMLRQSSGDAGANSEHSVWELWDVNHKATINYWASAGLPKSIHRKYGLITLVAE